MRRHTCHCHIYIYIIYIYLYIHWAEFATARRHGTMYITKLISLAPRTSTGPSPSHPRPQSEKEELWWARFVGVVALKVELCLVLREPSSRPAACLAAFSALVLSKSIWA